MTDTMPRRVAACAFSLLLAACAAGVREPAEVDASGDGEFEAAVEQPSANVGAAAPSGGAGGSAEAVEEALDRALDEGWQQLHIRAECPTDAGADTVEIFSEGVAIWNQRAQFALTHEELRRILQGFVSTDFAHLRDQYGGDKWTEPLESSPGTPPGPDPNRAREAPPRIICLVFLDLDGISKQAVQLQGGVQSTALRSLANLVLEICREPAQSGVTADSLTDGLTKVASRELAPESLRILVHRRPLNGEGWLLQVRGGTASTRTLVPGKGYEDPRTLALDRARIEELAQLLADPPFENLPGNLYAEHYTDLKVSVLDHHSKVQAMQFAGMTPTLHGEQQQYFDRVYEELRALHEWVLEKGR